MMRHSFMIMMMLGVPGAIVAQQPPAGSTTAAVSPDGKRIAFTSDRSGTPQIYTIAIDGTDEVQFTTAPGPKGSPFWGPGGGLFYGSFARDTTTFFHAAGEGVVHRIGAVPGRMAVISPDLKRVVYSMGNWTANKLMVADVDGANARQVVDSTSIAWNMKWSPDGKQIAFTGRPDGAKGLAVFVMNADGSGRRQVTHLAAESGNAQLPAWSPDGRRLAVQVSDTMRTGGIWVVDVATGSARPLAAHKPGYEDEIPTWFPDGKRIAFQSDRTGKMEIFVMNDDGTGVKQLTGRPR